MAQGGTALGNRQPSHAITLDAVWRGGEDFGERDIAWSRGSSPPSAASAKACINFLGGDENRGRSARRMATGSTTGW